MTRKIYKLLTLLQWETLQSCGQFDGAPIDLTDGYMHFSTAQQAQETADKHFAQHDAVILARCGAADYGDALIWEPSRGGVLFPHLYGQPLLISAVERYWTLNQIETGFVFPPDF